MLLYAPGEPEINIQLRLIHLIYLYPYPIVLHLIISDNLNEKQYNLNLHTKHVLY